MNWKLILQLSMFGLIMAFGTISLIPEKFEFVFWIVIFAIVAYIIAKVCTGKYFLHGFLVSIFNSIYLTTTHTLFSASYNAHHTHMAQILPAGINIFAYTIGVVLGLGSFLGLIQGLFAFIASKLVKPKLST